MDTCFIKRQQLKHNINQNRTNTTKIWDKQATILCPEQDEIP